MQIISQSEWMIDEKHAEVMGPGKGFKVIQTSSGTSVFFSIGSDSRLYASREVQSSSTGWTRVDLSQTIPTQSIIKAFAVAQNPDTLYFDLGIIVRIGNTDKLFLSQGNPNTDDAWSQAGVKWTAVPFDDERSEASADSLEIDGLYMMTLPSAGKPAGSLTCFVDVLRGATGTNSLGLLDRYYITPGSSLAWQKHGLAIDLSAGSISSCLGRRAKDQVGGIYTFGKIASKLELIYAPAYDFWDPKSPPAPSRLALPRNANSVASSFDKSGRSHLFVSGQDGVFYFPPDKQKDGAHGVQIISSPLVSLASHLTAETSGDITALYGQSPQGDLFFTTCKAGSEASRDSWSIPMPLVSQIESYSFFVNKKAGHNSVFAHVKGRDVMQLTQDPVTNDWASRSILLPSTDVDNVVSLSTFTTRVICQDKSGVGLGNTDVLLKSTSPVGVYVNDSYRILSPNIDITAKTDPNGVINIIQPTQDMAAVCYQVTLAGQQEVSNDVDPGAKVKSRLMAIQSGNDLKKAEVIDKDGSSRSLIPADVSTQNCDAAAAAIKQLMKVSESLPQNGACQQQALTPVNISANSTNEQSSPALAMTVPDHGSGMKITLGNAIVMNAENILVRAGDLFRSILHTAWNAVKDFVIRAANGLYEVLVSIGNNIYRAVLDSVAAVSHAVEWVFTKIRVAWEDVKSFLGFVFNWKDIIRTHKVIKSVTTKYALHSVSKISEIQNFISTGIDSLEGKINDWADLPDEGNTVGQLSALAEKQAGVNDPQTHYMEDKIRSNFGSAETSSKDTKSGWSGVLDDLKGLASDQKETLTKALDQINTQILSQFTELTPMEIVKRLLAIVGNLVLNVAKSLIVQTLGIIRDLTTAVIDLLNEPIKIPVISKLYQSISGEELSIMDLMCLLAAVPATILYKVVTGDAPFADNAVTDSVIQAPDFPAIQDMMTENPSVYKSLSIVSEFAAMAGLAGHSIANGFKAPWMAKGKPTEVPGLLMQVSIPIKLLVLMPSFIRPRSNDSSWEEQMDDAVTDIAFLKTCLDATTIGGREAYGTVSPYIDYAISAVWIVPSVGRMVANHAKPSSYMSLTTSLAYDVSLMTGPIVWDPALDPESKLLVLAAANGLIAVAAGIRAARGGLLHNNE